MRIRSIIHSFPILALFLALLCFPQSSYALPVDVILTIGLKLISMIPTASASQSGASSSISLTNNSGGTANSGGIDELFNGKASANVSVDIDRFADASADALPNGQPHLKFSA